MGGWIKLCVLILFCISVANYFLLGWLTKKGKIKKTIVRYYLLYMFSIYIPALSATGLLFYSLTDTYSEWSTICFLCVIILGVVTLMHKIIPHMKYNWIVFPLGIIIMLGTYYLMTNYTLDNSLLGYIGALLGNIYTVKRTTTRNVKLIHMEAVAALIIGFIFCFYIDMNYVAKPQKMVQELLVLQEIDKEYVVIQHGRAERGIPIEVIALRKYENSGVRERLTYEYYEGKITLIKEE